MPTTGSLYANQGRISRAWRPAGLYSNLPGIAKLYGQDALLNDQEDPNDPLRRRLNEMGAESIANGPASTRSTEIAARLGQGASTSQLKSMIPSEAAAALSGSSNKGFGANYMSQLASIGNLGSLATQIQQAKNAYRNAQPTGGGGGGGLNLGDIPKGARQRAIKYAYSQIGVPYVWGGTTPGRGLDCSGLVQWAYGKAGIRLPRVSQQQMTRGVRTSISRLVPGDLIGWGHPAHHIAIYLGGGRILEAPRTGLRVRVISLSQKGPGAWGIHLNI